MGLEGQADKAVDQVSDARVLGVQFCNGKRLQTRGDKLWDLLEAFMDLLPVMRASPKEMQIHTGLI